MRAVCIDKCFVVEVNSVLVDLESIDRVDLLRDEVDRILEVRLVAVGGERRR